MKSFKYAGGCLVCCPRSRRGGVLSGRLLSFTGGVAGLLVYFFALLFSGFSGWGPLLRGGFVLPDPARVPEVMASDPALEMVDVLLQMEAVSHFLPSLLPTA